MVWRTLDVPKKYMPKGPNILINFEFCLIIQQEFVEAIDIVLNHYNDPIPLRKHQKEFQKQCPQKQCGFLVFQNN